MTIPCFWVSRMEGVLARGYADQGLLEAMLDRSLWAPPGALTFEHHEVRGDFPDADGAVVIINARTHVSYLKWLNIRLGRLDWAVLILCGDEECQFPWQMIQHPNLRLWVMQPRPEHAGCGLLPGGWYPGSREHLRKHDGLDRPLDWFFAGQVTHARRQACARELRALEGGELYETDGYLKEAIPRAEYFDRMAHAKVVPSPSGPWTPDTARTFEALEAGCVPIVDGSSAYGPTFDYLRLLFGEGNEVPTVWDWGTLPDAIREALAQWPANANAIYARWQQWKRRIVYELDADIRRLAELPLVRRATPDDQVTVIIPTSPVPRHPATDHIETVIDSIRERLPLAEIIVTFDGVRPEMEHRRADYEEYTRRLLWLTNFRWPNVVPIVCEEWGHQANATRAALELVTTPLVLFVEHDTPLVGESDWTALCQFVLSGEANVVQFHESPAIHADHERVLLDSESRQCNGVPVRRTAAWWQRPHLASTRFYRERVMPHFSLASRTMIEDKLYGIIWSDYADYGEAGWWDWRLWVYCPDDDTPLGIRRSGHLDSRGDDEKFEMVD